MGKDTTHIELYMGSVTSVVCTLLSRCCEEWRVGLDGEKCGVSCLPLFITT